MLKSSDRLFDNVARILDEARGQVVRAVNSSMVIAYWLIGREIVHELQSGEERAGYGEEVIAKLSVRLTRRYGRGFSEGTLWNFRQFYLTYTDRQPRILSTTWRESEPAAATRILSTTWRESSSRKKKAAPVASADVRTGTLQIIDTMLEAVQSPEPPGFFAGLSWSHYRALMRVENRAERQFYEIEAGQERWVVAHLERQIHTFLFARLLKSRNKAGVMALTRKGLEIEQPSDVIKSPYVLDFLGLPDSGVLHESKLETSIIGNLQAFLLELGKGFAFIARQKRLQFDHEHFYVDLVFYHCILKCYVLIDLKIGRLAHQDIGQMDSYVRMFDAECLSPGDNPTIGLILCSEKNEAVAKYSILREHRKIFASRYSLHLPTEEELQNELVRERRLIEHRSPLLLPPEKKPRRPAAKKKTRPGRHA